MANDIPFYFKSKQALLDKLVSLKPMVEKLDQEAIRKHKQEEKEWFQCFRKCVRARTKDLLALDYAGAKKACNNYYSQATIEIRDETGEKEPPPKCPVRAMDVLERAIAQVERCDERRFQIKSGGQYRYIHDALMLGVGQAGAVC